jgi:nicotinate-nucleotide adenylyltransferase
MAAERVGIFGGTFDPPHVGHLIAAVNARHDLGLHRMLVVPAGVPWQKVDQRAVSAATDRLAMAHATFGRIEGLEVSTMELDRQGESYTADTLDALRAADPERRLYLLVGSDIAPSLDTWKRPEDIRAGATVVVYERPGAHGCTPPAGWTWESVTVPQVEVSSTDIRERVRTGRPIEGLVTAEVATVIAAQGLYRDATDA